MTFIKINRLVEQLAGQPIRYQRTNGPEKAHLISGPRRKGPKCFHKHKLSVNLVICCMFFPLNDFVTHIPFKHTCDPI